ncbi:hypothetical protein F7725_024260 [Dissostichus mawsoni]|uniref:Uncharacterized protein n=1 Tax=Dissostichus mawsoni TaxID=36200 RepID=A0A7J5Y0D9_DISMA|nr:hypothetical protein F7725_024260 [Dissostichus mawsoni]
MLIPFPPPSVKINVNSASLHQVKSYLKTVSWNKIEPKGKGPCPRRRQCCCMVGDRIILFGGTSPCPEQGMGDEFNLMDHSDLYILDFKPNLKTLCKIAVIQYSLEHSGLPHDIRSAEHPLL